MSRYLYLICGLLVAGSAALADDAVRGEPREHSEIAPDVREQPTKLKFQRSDLVVVPIPISDPTLGTGLVLGAGYFWPQTEQQKAVQPASVTGIAGMYTSNDSYAFGIAQSNYWDEDRWRLDAILGYGRFNLDLRVPGAVSDETTIGWDLEGTFIDFGLLRQIGSDWYAGGIGRLLDIEQKFGIELPGEAPDDDKRFGSQLQSAGLGAKLIYDSRDKPINSYAGRYFEITALYNSEALGSDNTYWSYAANYRSYHRVHEQVVVAWEVVGCNRSDRPPLWDSCRISLRGFPQTEYLGVTSVSGQAEARWQFHRKFGAVGFAGVGYIKDSFADALESEQVPSYGVGVRYLVLEKHRINVRLDYGRSKNNDAIYLSVTEAF